MREGKEEGERVGTRDYDNATEAQTEATSADTSRAKPKLSRKENSKVAKQIEDKNKRERESMMHDNADPSTDLTTGTAISAGKGGIGHDW
jgi:hypothetical protein